MKKAQEPGNERCYKINILKKKHFLITKKKQKHALIRILVKFGCHASNYC